MPKKYKSLKEEDPQLCLEWNFNKNKLSPSNFSLMSSKKVWWVCSSGHEWEMRISSRTAQKQNCPYCANKRACLDNCLATKYPEIAKEWDYFKNEKLTPFDVLPHSSKKVWWRCPENNHSWNSWIFDRVNDCTRCTQCLGYEIRDRKNINTIVGYKICKDCKLELKEDLFRIKIDKRDNNSERLDNLCKKCSELRVKKYRETDKGIAAEIVRRTKYICKKEDLFFDLDKKWIFERLNSIGWKCELTQIPFVKNEDGNFKLLTISVDRIFHKQGYTKDNIRFVLNQVNVFRNSGSDEQMYKIAEALIKNRKINE